MNCPYAGRPYNNLILPVSSSCIIPCFSSRVLSRFCSSAAISVSMAERMAAIRKIATLQIAKWL